jgi:large subunit ribosomal protein L21
MTNYAIIRTGGKQYQVVPEQQIKVEKLPGEKDDPVVFNEVLLTNIKGKISIGQPIVKGFSITGKIIDQVKAKKIKVSKFKAKSRYRRTTGHRQQQTVVVIQPF